MGSVIKQKSGKYAIRFDMPSGDGDRSQKQIGGFTKKADAEKELRRIEGEIASGEFFKASNVSVSEFIEIWLRDHVKPNLAPATYDFYEGLYRMHVKDYFKSTLLSELKANQIDRFYAHLKSTTDLSQTSVHHCHKMLRAALNKAVRWDYIKSSPMSKATAPRQEKKEMKYWDENSINAAIKYFQGTSIEWHVKVALFSGLRQGEICALNIQHIDFKNRTFFIAETAQRQDGKGIVFKAPKTEKSKATLPLTPQLESLFKDRLHYIKVNKMSFGKKYNKKYKGYLSVWQNGDIMDPKYIGREFHRLLKEQTAIPMIRFHDLRHSCAAWLISQGVDLKTIQEILRHADFSTTANIYGHITLDTKMDALEKLKLKA